MTMDLAVRTSEPTTLAQRVDDLVSDALHFETDAEGYTNLSGLAQEALLLSDVYGWTGYLAIYHIRDLDLWRACPEQEFESFSDWLDDWCRQRQVGVRKARQRLASIRVGVNGLELSTEDLVDVRPGAMKAVVDRLNYDPLTGEVLDATPGRLTKRQAQDIVEDSKGLPVSETFARVNDEVGGPSGSYFQVEWQPKEGTEDVIFAGITFFDGDQFYKLTHGLDVRRVRPVPRAVARKLMTKLGAGNATILDD